MKPYLFGRRLPSGGGPPPGRIMAAASEPRQMPEAVARMASVFVAVTEYDWYEHLLHRPELTDVNFWSPSPRRLARLEPDTLVLFKLKARFGNRIVGGGFFVHFSVMPMTLAWDVFGQANGAATLNHLRDRILRLRHGRSPQLTDGVNLDIGCTVLASTFLIPLDSSLPEPERFPKTAVRGKGYDLSSSLGAQLFESALTLRAPLTLVDGLAVPRYGSPTQVRPRRGQAAFRALVTDAYARRCAITAERTLPVLEAAHVIPFSDGGEYSTRNGILLRSDLHRLFDTGYITVDPDTLRVRVSRAIHDEFHNGAHYYSLDGRMISAPRLGFEPLSREYLARHRDEVFKAG